MPSVIVNNVKLNYIEQGVGDEVVVFVHGYSGGLRDWTEVLERLPKEYHAYALDMRGHGQSGRTDSYELTEFVEDVYAFSQELGIGLFTYVGHSLGGKIGYQFALNHPDVLKTMVLAAPAPAHDFIPTDQQAAFIDIITSAFGSPEGLRGFYSQITNPPSEEVMSQLINDVIAADPTARRKCAVWWISTNLESQLGDIEVPILIVAGAKDGIPSNWERRYANTIKGCRFELWEDDGHFLPMENPPERRPGMKKKQST